MGEGGPGSQAGGMLDSGAAGVLGEAVSAGLGSGDRDLVLVCTDRGDNDAESGTSLVGALSRDGWALSLFAALVGSLCVACGATVVSLVSDVVGDSD